MRKERKGEERRGRRGKRGRGEEGQEGEVEEWPRGGGDDEGEEDAARESTGRSPGPGPQHSTQTDAQRNHWTSQSVSA